MNNTEFFNMIDRYHAPAKIAKIKTIYIFAGIALIGAVYFLSKATYTKSIQISALKGDLTSSNDQNQKLKSKIDMLEYDNKNYESAINDLTNEKKDLTEKLNTMSNSKNS